MMKRFWALVLAAVLLSAAGTAAVAATPSPMAATITEPHSATEVIVGFVPGTPGSAKANARAAAGAVRQEALSPLAADAEVLHLASGRTPEAAIAALNRNPNVRYVEPNYLLQATDTSDDPYFMDGSLWGMYTSSPSNEFGSQAADVWATGATGSADKYVVVIDEGINWAHPDLEANTWINPGEIAGDLVDDDKNGYVDDIQGWDFFHNDNTVYDVREDSHGTHVSGTIGGVGGNGKGVAGVNWDVTLISAKFLGPRGGYLDDAVKAVDYANDLKDKGFDIVATNNSWGGGAYSTALHDAINRGGDRGILFVAAAGNSATNNDVTPSYPSNYQCSTSTRPWDCVVAVAAIDKNGALASFSQYGAKTVDLGAPGVDIVSTLPGNTYGSYSGTSMATPHVSGAAALCASIGNLSGEALREALLASVTPTASLSGKTVTGGRLDVSNFPTRCSSAPSPLAIATTSLASGQVGVAYSQTLAATGGTSPYTWSATDLPSGLTLTVDTISGTPTTAGTFSFDVMVTDSASPTASQTATLSLTIAPALFETTFISVGPPTGSKKSTIPLTATLQTTEGVALSDKSVTFTFNGKTSTATTNSEGIAKVTPSTPRVAGTYSASVRFAGDATHATTKSSWTIKIT